MDTTTPGPDAGHRLGGRYVLVEPIGRGGSGVVWRATDEVLGRQVAVKVLRSDVTLHPSIRRSIEHEGRHAAALTSAGIPAVHDLGVDDGLPYLVMELVPGESLADRRHREGSLPVATAVGLAASAAEAVDAVHRAGIVHRDVKPSNLLLGDDGRVRLTDFGIARRSDPDSTVSGPVASLGTVQYVAPERARGVEPGLSGDVYSLGVVAYELLSGHPPFDGEPLAVLRAHVAALPPPLPDTVPDAVGAAVLRALQKDPAARPASAADFARELRAGLASQGDGAPTTLLPAADVALRTAPMPVPVERRPRRRRRRGVATPALFGLVLLAIVALAVITTGTDPGGRPGIEPTTPSVEPITTPAETVEEEPRSVDEPTPPAVDRERGGNGNGNGRGGGNGNGRGGRSG